MRLFFASNSRFMRLFQAALDTCLRLSRQPLFCWESAKVSHKRVFALLTPEIRGWKMAQMLQKPVFALPGCQGTSVNTLLCDTLGLADLPASQFTVSTSRFMRLRKNKGAGNFCCFGMLFVSVDSTTLPCLESTGMFCA